MGLFNVYTVSNSYRSDYFQYLSEQWSNDTDEFTGAWNRSSSSLITRVKTDTDMPKAQIALTANTTARLRTIFTFRCTPSQFTGAGSSTMVRGAFIEWEAKLSNVANVDNSIFFMGVNASASATRATTNLIAFGLASDNINSNRILSSSDFMNNSASTIPVVSHSHSIAIRECSSSITGSSYSDSAAVTS